MDNDKVRKIAKLAVEPSTSFLVTGLEAKVEPTFGLSSLGLNCLQMPSYHMKMKVHNSKLGIPFKAHRCRRIRRQAALRGSFAACTCS